MAQRVGWMNEQAASDDSQIVKRIAGGDRQALTELYARYQYTLFRYLLQLSNESRTGRRAACEYSS